MSECPTCQIWFSFFNLPLTAMCWSILKNNSWEGRDCAAEVRQIHAQFKETLGQKRHKGFCAVHNLRDACIASSQSIARHRAAIRAPWLLRSWMEQCLALSSSPPPPDNNPGGSWGPTEWIESANAWVGWRSDSTLWDGVTRTPKTPGKCKRQCRCRAQRRPAQAAAAAAFSEALHVELVAAQREWYMVEILPELTPEDRSNFMNSNLWTTTFLITSLCRPMRPGLDQTSTGAL
ncbi:hypothetical protein K438DRAFT_334915 [Mycena galopus ATCC 62051]|nr:hypothetical protein K438DRAFT_334915 [Mycena galopus ATCC 62051]